MSENVYDRFAEGEVKAFATKQDIPPHKFMGRFLRKVFPMLASSIMLFSSTGCSSEKENIDGDGCVNYTTLSDDQIIKLMTTNRFVLFKDKNYNHSPLNNNNYWNVVNQGLNIINNLSSTSSLSEKEILDYKKTAVEMLIRMKSINNEKYIVDLSDEETLKSFLFFEKVVEYKDDYSKVFSNEAGVYNEQSILFGKNYEDCYELINKAKVNSGIYKFADALYKDSNRFLIKEKDIAKANEISLVILKDWLEANGVKEDNLYKSVDVDDEKAANTVAFYCSPGNDVRAELKIDPTGDLGDGCYSPVGITVIHELMHVMQKKPSSNQSLREKDHLIEELAPTLKTLMLEDMTYKTIHKIPMNNVVNYGYFEVGKNKVPYGELAVWFRNMTDKYKDLSVEKVLSQDEVFSKIEAMGNGQKVNLLQSNVVGNSLGRN